MAEGRDPHVAPPSDVPETMPLRVQPQSGHVGTLPTHFPPIPRNTYEIGLEVARGGIGRVVRAHDNRLGRTVAIKELLPGRGGRARFIREAVIAARLEHPAIVPVHEAGQWPDGQPFYAMKLVSGRSLAEVIALARTFAARLALVPKVTAVAQAIAYAHDRRVIHRDLKPHNVIVGDYGETVVVDWGLAKDLEDHVPEPEPEPAAPSPAVGDTVAGEVLGTPPYMPPEQARGQAVDERADVYALGAMLYHVLAGAAPYLATSSRVAVTGRQTPSTVKSGPRSPADILTEVITTPPLPLALLAPDTPDDLLIIVAKAMARDRAERYPSAKAFADDLLRFQTGQLVSSRRYTRWALLRRWVARNTRVLAVAGVFLLILALMAAFGIRRIVFAKRAAEQQRAVAEAQRLEADEARGEAEAKQAQLIVQHARSALDSDPTEALAWLKHLPRRADVAEARGIAVDAAAMGVARHVWRAHTEGIWWVAVSSDGRHVVSASADHTVRLWDLATGATRQLGRHEGDVNAAAFSPDGELVATGGDDGEIRIWRVHGEAGPVAAMTGHGPVVSAVTFLPDGQHVLSSAFDGTVRIWEVARASGRILVGPGPRVSHVALSPDGQRFATAGQDGNVIIHDAAGRALRTVATGRNFTHALAFSSDDQLVVGAEDGYLALVKVAGGPPRVLVTGGPAMLAAAFSPDGSVLAVGSGDRSVRLWDLATGRTHVLLGHVAAVTSVAFAPDGHTLVSASSDRTLRVWPVVASEERILPTEGDSQLGVAFSPDGQTLATAGESGRLRLFALAPGMIPPPRKIDLGQPIHWLAYAAGGRIAAAGIDGSMAVWDPGATAPRHLATGPGTLTAFPEVSADGKLVVWGTPGPLGLHVRELTGGEGSSDVPLDTCHAVKLVEGGARLAFASRSEVRICETRRCGETRRMLYREQGWVESLDVSPDGTLLASGGRAGVVGLYDLARGTSRSLGVRGAAVTRVLFSPDRQTLAVARSDGPIELWDLVTVTPRRLEGHALAIHTLVFSPDGRVMVSSSIDQTTRVWDTATGESRALRAHRDRANTVAFAPDGQTFATASRDGSVSIWPLDVARVRLRDRFELDAWLTAATTARIDRGGAAVSPVADQR